MFTDVIAPEAEGELDAIRDEFGLSYDLELKLGVYGYEVWSSRGWPVGFGGYTPRLAIESARDEVEDMHHDVSVHGAELY